MTAMPGSHRQLVAHAPHRQDVPGVGGIGFDLRPQPPDVDVDEAPVAEVVVSPDPVEELFAAEDLARVGGQLAQQPELGAGAVHLLADPRRTVPSSGRTSTSPKVSTLGSSTDRARRSKRPDPRRQLLGDEGLGDVVVGAGFQPGHHVVGVGAGRDHDDGHRTGAPQLAAALEPVHARAA